MLTNRQVKDVEKLDHNWCWETRTVTFYHLLNIVLPLSAKVIYWGPSWSRSYGRWMYNSTPTILPMQSVPITTKVVSSNQLHFIARCARYNIMWSSFLVTSGRSVVFSGNLGFLHQKKIYNHDIPEILLKVALNTINLTPI